MPTFSLNEATESALMLRRTYPLPAAKVRKTFLDGKQLEKWWPVEGAKIVFSQWEPKIGNTYRIDSKTEVGEPVVTIGEFQDVSDQMLVFSWAREGKHDIGGTLVTVEFRKVPKGTELALTHELLPNRAARESHQSEWTARLDRLQRLLA